MSGGLGNCGARRLQRDGIKVTLEVRTLLPSDLLAAGESQIRIGHVVPMRLKRLGVESRLIIPGSGETSAASRSDPALLRAVARGYQWIAELTSGTSVSTKQIALREGLSESYVRHVVPLGLLAPTIIESVCAGKQSPTLSAERLKTQADIPIDWAIQERLISG